jgi:hypothetical protein
LLSLHGLLFTAIGLYFASLVEKTLSALVYTYLAVFGYIGAIWALMNSLGELRNLEVPFSGVERGFGVSLIPPLVEFGAGTSTTVFGIAVPNFLLVGAFTFAGVNFLLKCAGGFLTPLQLHERRPLRLQTMGIVAALSALVGASGAFKDPSQGVALLPLVPLLFFLPFLVCYSSDGERSQRHGKPFVLADLWGRSVAGALPLIYAMFSTSMAGYAVAGWWAHHALPEHLLATVAYGFGFWTFAWSTARFASSFNLPMRSGRVVQFGTLMALIGAPLPLLVTLTASTSVMPEYVHAVWRWFVMAPFVGQGDPTATPILAALLFAGGVAISAWSERNFARRTEKQSLAKVATAESSTLADRLATDINQSPVQVLGLRSRL